MSQQDRDLIQRMGMKPRCPICQAAYWGDNVKLIRDRGGRYLFHIECPGCHSYIINVTLDSFIGISSLYMVSDFTQEDLAQFVDGSPVTCDEVIEVYDQLNRDRGANSNSLKGKGFK